MKIIEDDLLKIRNDKIKKILLESLFSFQALNYPKK